MTPEELDVVILKWRNKDSFFVMSACLMILAGMAVIAIVKWIAKKYCNRDPKKKAYIIEWM